ncbi:protein-methionine sulfoxide oxidase mical2b isoform X2 [Scleropages formosus]|uniref:protein-methionine sulfoxide oxidase mical2b isoform X2 n=1 Tax=Scleropages formosus TaxID=113540 RepID=UPI000878B54B|nr:MICAL-like protein 2 isoform X2 [Scleropages formosus]
MAAVKALQQWCRVQCEGYRDVAITNMTTSFRDGLAFCALIHKHRPDLINYDSLQKEDIYENNKLAFNVAEEKLGIPALLDAEDMVALKVPDRLSILTYVSQYYNYFHGRSPIGGMAGVKRPAEDSKEQPPGKKCEPVVAKPFPGKPTADSRTPHAVSPSIASTVTPKPRETKPAEQVLVEHSKKGGGTLSSTCAVCKNHVHLVQRHLVDGKLYHRNCFKCKECSNILLSGTYKAGPEPGTFICTSHQTPLKGRETLTAGPAKTGPVTNKVASGWAAVNKESSPTTQPSTANTRPINPRPSSATPTPVKAWTPLAEKTQTARQKFFESPANAAENSKPTNPTLASRWPSFSTESTGTNKVPQSVEDQKKEKAKLLISKKLMDENSNNSNTTHSLGPKPADNRLTLGSDTPSWKKDQNSPGVTGLKKVDSSSPVGSTTASKGSPWLKTIELKTSGPAGAPSVNNKDAAVSESPSDWRSKLKPVSKGPKLTEPQESPLAGKTKATHQPPKTPSSGPATSTAPSAKPNSQTAPSSEQSSNGSGTGWGFKNGKGSSPANTSKPEIKSPKARPDYIPKEEILKELKEIEDNLNDLEKKGVELEKRLRRCEEEGEEDVLMDDLMVDWFTLIRNKQVYMRRESELVYIAKTQDLEEQQPGVEQELRRLIEKPEHLKTLADRKREQELMEKLVEIVNDRNAIVEGLDEDRLREEEEDQQLNEMMKNLDVKKNKNKKKSPITKFFKR